MKDERSVDELIESHMEIDEDEATTQIHKGQRWLCKQMEDDAEHIDPVLTVTCIDVSDPPTDGSAPKRVKIVEKITHSLIDGKMSDEFLTKLAERLVKDRHMPIAVYLCSEAWRLECKSKDEMEAVRKLKSIKAIDEKVEVVVVSGATFHPQRSYCSDIPIERDYENNIFLGNDAEWEPVLSHDGNQGSKSLHTLFDHYTAELVKRMSKEQLEELKGDVSQSLESGGTREVEELFKKMAKGENPLVDAEWGGVFEKEVPPTDPDDEE